MRETWNRISINKNNKIEKIHKFFKLSLTVELVCPPSDAEVEVLLAGEQSVENSSVGLSSVDDSGGRHDPVPRPQRGGEQADAQTRAQEGPEYHAILVHVHFPPGRSISCVIRVVKALNI